jgi:hypothetical protein
MSNVVRFPRRKRRRTLSYLSAGSDGSFVLHSGAQGNPLEALGPFSSVDHAREFAIDAAKEIGADIAWTTFPHSPRNGGAA